MPNDTLQYLKTQVEKVSADRDQCSEWLKEYDAILRYLNGQVASFNHQNGPSPPVRESQGSVIPPRRKKPRKRQATLFGKPTPDVSIREVAREFAWEAEGEFTPSDMVESVKKRLPDANPDSIRSEVGLCARQGYSRRVRPGVYVSAKPKEN